MYLTTDRLVSRRSKGVGETGAPVEQGTDPLIKRETLELVRAYYKIRATGVRKRVSEMVRALASGNPMKSGAGRNTRKVA